MKTKFLLFFLLVFSFSTSAFAQTIIIKPKKVVYTRKGKQIEKERKTFSVTYPMISGALSADVKKNLENTVSYWNNFETTLKENLGDEFWLTDLYYKVNYNKRSFLDISLTQEGVGAYSSENVINLIINLKTGKQIKFKDVFDENSLNEFAKLVDRKLAVEKTGIIKNITKNAYGNAETEVEKESNENMINDLEFTTESFDEFSISDKGVTILYDAGFAHAWLALQPEGRYFFTWAQLQPFIRRGGLLEKFIR